LFGGTGGTPYTTEVVKVHGKYSIDYSSTHIHIVHSLLDEKPVPDNPSKDTKQSTFFGKIASAVRMRMVKSIKGQYQ